jgi:uncharacterized BrkB/YihY/UPF0761 family membrane protein
MVESFHKIIYMALGIIIFAALFPTALTQLFAVNVSSWKHYDTTTGTMTQDTLAITLWNLIPWMVIIFGGLLIWIAKRER